MTVYKKRAYKKRANPVRAMRLRTNRSRVPSSKFTSDVHYFKRWAVGPTITGAAGYLPYLDVFRYTFNQLPGSAEFVALFDHYSITKVVTKIWLKIDPSAQTAAAASYPKLYYARDFDDSTLPSSLDNLREHSNCKIKVLNPNRPVTLVSKPNVLALSYTSGVASNYTPKWKAWLDCADTATPHYAWKYAIDDLTNTNYKVNVEHCFYFKCKAAR